MQTIFRREIGAPRIHAGDCPERAHNTGAQPRTAPLNSAHNLRGSAVPSVLFPSSPHDSATTTASRAIKAAESRANRPARSYRPDHCPDLSPAPARSSAGHARRLAQAAPSAALPIAASPGPGQH
jgi:hypothetical protein